MKHFLSIVFILILFRIYGQTINKLIIPEVAQYDFPPDSTQARSITGAFGLSTLYIFDSDKNSSNEKHASNFRKAIPRNKPCQIWAITKLQNFEILTNSIN